ncbi:MAG: hypothetical protein PVI23_06020 [Maricaulaceae bacterium]|jgi:tetratricopeptide (TPR) repeat protein
MAEAGEESLAELIAREQRGFRRILSGGLVLLLLMALISALSGAYLYVASQRLAETTLALQRHAFETRRRVDTQNNRIVAQEISIRRAYDEIRAASGEGRIAPTSENIDAAREAARNFLLRGRMPSLAEERSLEQFGEGGVGAVDPATRNLFTGVSALVSYESRGGQIVAGATELPPELTDALDAFETVRADRSLRALGYAGTAWVLFEDASSGRNNYTTEACEAVFDAVAQSVMANAPSPQPLYWQAQCERKLGMTSEALGDYARALRASADAGDAASRDAAEMQLAMNAFHGVGTTLIAGADIPDDAPGMAEALAIAGEACPRRGAYAERSPRMALALSCLDEAIALRRALGQTDNQLSGSGENISFAHLRDGDVNAAYEHTVEVERTGLFAWNEVMRALTAARADYDDRAASRAAAAAAADARRNVSMFTVGQFNVCELKALYDLDMYEAAREIIAETHPGEEVGCPSAE